MIYEFVVRGGPWMVPILGVSVIGLMFVLLVILSVVFGRYEAR